MLESMKIIPIINQIIYDVMRYAKIPLAYPKVDIFYIMICSSIATDPKAWLTLRYHMTDDINGSVLLLTCGRYTFSC